MPLSGNPLRAESETVNGSFSSLSIRFGVRAMLFGSVNLADKIRLSLGVLE